jgi:hypothetical protein
MVATGGAAKGGAAARRGTRGFPARRMQAPDGAKEARKLDDVVHPRPLRRKASHIQ